MRIENRDNFYGDFSVPGDKSVTHRAVMLGAAAQGESVITGALLGEDCLSTVSCMRELGAEIEISGNCVRVRGAEKFNAGKKLYVGNSGTTIRLLSGLLCGRGVSAELYGDSSIMKRPMGRIIEPLSLMRADIKGEDGRAPLRISPSALKGITYRMPVASAQVKSCILLAGLGADGETTVLESEPSRDHTEIMLEHMGADIERGDGFVTVRKSGLTAGDTAVPADISSAAYFMALGALLGGTTVKNVGLNPTRTGILDVFDRMGVKYEISNKNTLSGEAAGDVAVKKSAFGGCEIDGALIPRLVDELPVIAVMAAFANGRTVISGAEELKFKESDRIKTTAKLINGLGGRAEETADGLIIYGEGLRGGCVQSFGDHRIAMSGAVALAASAHGGEIFGAECVNISFPDFFEKLGAEL